MSREGSAAGTGHQALRTGRRSVPSAAWRDLRACPHIDQRARGLAPGSTCGQRRGSSLLSEKARRLRRSSETSCRRIHRPVPAKAQARLQADDHRRSVRQRNPHRIAPCPPRTGPDGGRMTEQAVTLTACGKPAPPPSHSTWKTLRVSHRLTASTAGNSPLTSYRGTHDKKEL